MAISTQTILRMVADRFALKRDTTRDRLKLQKTIYLLQAYGLKLGYGFSWYRYGPYSQDLVLDAHTVLSSEKTRYDNDPQNFSFNTESEKRFEEFKKICGGLLDNIDQLELVASVDFVRHIWYADEVEDRFPDLFIARHKRQLFSGKEITGLMIKEALIISKKLRQN